MKDQNIKVLCLKIAADGNELIIDWASNENHTSKFHAQWLRFRCECNDCHPGLIPGSWENRIRYFSDDLSINNAYTEEKGNICITFDNDILKNHVTTYDPTWLWEKCYCNTCLENKLQESDVINRYNNANKGKNRKIEEIDWLDYEADKNGWLFNWMRCIIENGICMVNNAPMQDDELKKMSSLLGDLLVSLFVADPNDEYAVFDYVASKEYNTSTENSGHQSGSIGLHQDYGYHVPTHDSIALHMCTRFDQCIEGGDSIIVDLFEAADLLKAESSQHFKALCEIPAIFHYTEKGGKSWCLQKTNIVVDYYGKVTSVHWTGDHSPLLQVRHEDVDRYYNAYKAFSSILEDREEVQYRFRHTPGKMACFSNMRMVHSRKGFKQNGGQRRLICIAVNAVNMKANYMELAKKLNISVPLPKIGNMSSF